MKNTETKTQSEKFKATAKEVEADDDEKAFDKTLKKIVEKSKIVISSKRSQ